jgi:hypothetical protein
MPYWVARCAVFFAAQALRLTLARALEELDPVLP